MRKLYFFEELVKIIICESLLMFITKTQMKIFIEFNLKICKFKAISNFLNK